MQNIAAAITEVKALLGDRLSTAKAQLDLHGANETYFAHTPPDAVAFVNSTQEVSDVVKVCARHGCPIVPWGVGTSLEGHALPVKGGITLNMQNMDQVLETYQEDLQVRVQPGVTREALNEDLRATGLFFPIDPGANATIGGMTATRASGTTAVRYGTMKDNVLALEVVLADGRIIRTGSRAKKSSAGYDLTRLFVGSEGTLGVITEITLGLQGQPEAISAATCDFPDVESAVSAVIASVQMGIPMARIELIDELCIEAINTYSGYNMPQVPHLFMEFHGSEVGVKDQSETMKSLAKDFGGGDFQWTTKQEDRNKLWAARHNAFPSLKSMKPGWKVVTTDICVPISQLATAIADADADIKAMGMYGPILGHVGDGNYHASIFYAPDDDEGAKRAKEVAGRMAERALELGGTVTGEHGVGLGKMKYMEAEHGQGWNVMADIKRSFDPTNIMNPGKVVQVN